MCGLVGYVGRNVVQRERAFKDMLNIDMIRGMDSTGVGFVHMNGDIEVVKDAVLPPYLMEDKDFKSNMMRVNLVLMGHNRYATKGKVTKENAHPFLHGNILGAHNGTIHNKWKFPDGYKFDVDSDALIHSIHKQGIAETWKIMDGAAALTWWDGDEASMNFLVNTERPLWLMITDEKDGIFWASERNMIVLGALRNGQKLGDFICCIPNKHYSVRFNSKFELDLREEVLVPFVEEKVFSRTTSTTPRRDVFGAGSKKEEKGKIISFPKKIVKPLSNAERKAIRKLEKQQKRKDEARDKGFVIGYRGERLDKTKFEQRYPRCFSCNTSLVFEDENNVVVDGNNCMCGDCHSTAVQHRMIKCE